MAASEEQTAVHTEPKLFVGQLPGDSTDAALRSTFGSYGTIIDLSLPRNPATGELRRFAMVTYDTWAQAELAMTALHGSKALGGDRALVVRMADPPKAVDPNTGMASKGIAPKKLFVGQVCW